MIGIRIVTWNIHGFLGQDGRFDPDRTAGILAGLKPDIAAIQEVIGIDRGVDGFALLREAMGAADMVAANVNRRIAGIYGQVLLSRYPIRWGHKVDISVVGREPRRAIDALIDTPGAPTRVIATHLGLAGGERRFQIGELCGLVEARPENDTVLLGDVNEWRRRGFAERRLSSLLGPGTRDRTYPAARPVFPLDRIWARTRGRVFESRAAREAGLASDHLPLVMDIEPAVTGQREAAAIARSSQSSSSSDSAVTPVGRV